MIGKTSRRQIIHGIYGQVDYCDLSIKDNEREKYANARHSVEEMDIDTGETVSQLEDCLGLPNNITSSEYFKMALIQAINNISQPSSSHSNTIASELRKINRSLEQLVEMQNEGLPLRNKQRPNLRRMCARFK